MMEFLKNWTLNIVTFTILIILFEIMMPTGKIKKFVNLISGFILLIVIISPFARLFNKNIDINILQMSNSNFIDRKEIENNSKFLKEEQLKQITEVYRKKIISQLEDSTREIGGIEDVKADVIINEDYNSPHYGEIKRVYLDIKTTETERNIKPVINVKKVEINKKPELMKSTQNTSNEEHDKLKNDIQSKVIKLFGINHENIVLNFKN